STFVGRPGIYLEDIFVEPEHRGHGIGAALLARIAKIACDRNCGRLEWSVLTWNEPAIGFYERLGARRMEDWRVFRLAGAALRDLAGAGWACIQLGSPRRTTARRKTCLGIEDAVPISIGSRLPFFPLRQTIPIITPL